MSSRASLAALTFLVAAAAARDVQAAPVLVASFDDAPHDATGPGKVVPPGDSEFADGDFDLRKFEVLVDGEDVLFEVTLGQNVRVPFVTQRTNSTQLSLWSGIFLQNVDIYIDSDRTPGSGSGECIPGRRVAFAEGRTWESAVVMTPQPGAAQDLTVDALGKAAGHVLFPKQLQVRGRTLIARVKALDLGGMPQKSWGYSVHVSGAQWERTFAVVDRVRGTRELNAFTMPVLTIPEAWAFGGGTESALHPRVVDVLLPAGMDQKAILGGYDDQRQLFARVPFVDEALVRAAAQGSLKPLDLGLGRAPAAGPLAVAVSPIARPGELVVVDLVDDMISVKGPTAGIQVLQFGRVLGPDGAQVGRVMVQQVVEGGLVVRPMDGKDRIVRGARVVFEAPSASP